MRRLCGPEELLGIQRDARAYGFEQPAVSLNAAEMGAYACYMKNHPEVVAEVVDDMRDGTNRGPWVPRLFNNATGKWLTFDEAGEAFVEHGAYLHKVSRQ